MIGLGFLKTKDIQLSKILVEIIESSKFKKLKRFGKFQQGNIELKKK